MSRNHVRESQRVVQDLLRAVVRREPIRQQLGEVFVDSQAIDPAAGSGAILSQALVIQPPGAALLVTSKLLSSAAGLLRECPFIDATGARCGRVFVARTNQRRCRVHRPVVKQEQDRRALAKFRNKKRKERLTNKEKED